MPVLKRTTTTAPRELLDVAGYRAATDLQTALGQKRGELLRLIDTLEAELASLPAPPRGAELRPEVLALLGHGLPRDVARRGEIREAIGKAQADLANVEAANRIQADVVANELTAAARACREAMADEYREIGHEIRDAVAKLVDAFQREKAFRDGAASGGVDHGHPWPALASERLQHAAETWLADELINKFLDK